MGIPTVRELLATFKASDIAEWAAYRTLELDDMDVETKKAQGVKKAKSADPKDIFNFMAALTQNVGGEIK